MAFDEDLANRIREILSTVRGVDEKPMFGGLAFLVHGNMSVAANRDGGLLVRSAPADTEKLLQRPHVESMVMGGREMRGWLRVAPDGLKTTRQLKSWVDRGVGFALTLPAK